MRQGICALSLEQVAVTNVSFELIPVSFTNSSITIVDETDEDGSDGDGSHSSSYEGAEGYLIDSDQDGILDTFHSNKTGENTKVQEHNNGFLIDSNGEGLWDFIFNPHTKEMTPYQPPSTEEEQTTTSTFLYVGIIGVILVSSVVFLILRQKRHRL